MYKHAVFLCILCYFIVQDAGAEDLEFVILHNNDMHARFEEYDNPYSNQKVGGMGRTAYVIKQARKAAESGEGPPVLYLNGGDTFTGTVWYAVHKWKIVADFMNLLKPDAASLGNHEFNHGIPTLVSYLKAISFRTLCANIDYTNQLDMRNVRLPPSMVLRVKGRRVGIIGYLTQDTMQVSLVDQVKITDEVVAVEKASTHLKRAGVDIIIALGHSGLDVDIMIAKQVSLVDIVVGAHGNMFLYTGIPPDKERPFSSYPIVVEQVGGKRIPILTTYGFTKYMGNLSVRFNGTGSLIKFSGQPIFLRESVPQDEAALALLDKYRPAVRALKEVVGKTTVYLIGSDDDDTCRHLECALGNLITDSFVHAMTTLYRGPHWADTPIALINSGAIGGEGIDIGDITKYNILETLSYDEQLITCVISGRNFLETLEHSVHSEEDTKRGEFLQVSGVRVVYSSNAPPYERIISVHVRCAKCKKIKYHPLDISASYKIVITYFLSRGGDGYQILLDKCGDKILTNYTDSKALLRYVQEKKVVSPKVEGRIVDVDSSPKANVYNTLLCISVLLSYLIRQYLSQDSCN